MFSDSTDLMVKVDSLGSARFKLRSGASIVLGQPKSFTLEVDVKVNGKYSLTNCKIGFIELQVAICHGSKMFFGVVLFCEISKAAISLYLIVNMAQAVGKWDSGCLEVECLLSPQLAMSI